LNQRFIKVHKDRLRILYLFVASVAVFFGVTNLVRLNRSPTDACTWRDTDKGVTITHIESGKSADVSGLRPGDIVLRIAGENAVTSYRAQQILDRQEVGKAVSYLIYRDGNLFERSVTLIQRGLPLFFTIMSAVGFVYWIVGLWIVWMRPHDLKARVLFSLFISFMLFWTLNIVAPHGGVMRLMILFLHAASFTTVPSLFLMFFLLYPTRHPILVRRPWIRFVIFSPTAWVLILFILALVFHTPSPVNFFFGFGLWGIYFTLGMFCLHQSLRKTENRQIRRQIRVLYTGLVIGLAPVFLLILPSLLGYQFPLTQYSALLMLCIPVVFAYTVVRHRLMDIDFIIRKSFVYTLLTGLIAGFYFLLIQVVERLLQSVGNPAGTVTLALATLGIAVIFAPLREKIQHIVDKAFYRQAYDYRTTLRQFAEALHTLIEIDMLAKEVLDTICQTMHLVWGSFYIPDERGHQFRAYHVWSEENLTSTSDPIPEKTAWLETVMQKRVSCRLSESDADKSDMSTPIHASVFVPFFIQDQLAGFMLLGEKHTGMPFSAEDFDLLNTLAHQVAVALENGRLHEALTEQERMKRELEIARQIQLNSLPQTRPSIPGFDIYGCSIPALEVGGDYFDYIPLSDDCTGFIIGDVSGKGTSAALIQSKIQGFVRALFPLYPEPKQLLVKLNSLTFQSTDSKSFATVIAAVLNHKTKTLTSTRAGHMAILHYRAGIQKCERWIPAGMGLAIDDGPLFGQTLSVESRTLDPGDVILLYTDGLTEADNDVGEEMGEMNLQSVFVQLVEKNAEDIGKDVIDSVRQFSGDRPQRDDMTLVVIKSSD